MNPTLSVRLRPSPVLALALTAMAVAALACCWISLPSLAFWPCAAGILLTWIWHFPPALQRGPRAVRGLELDASGDARWQDASGLWIEAGIKPGSYVSDWLIVANLAASADSGPRDRSLVLLPGCAAPEELRQLRVWLRWRLGRQ